MKERETELFLNVSLPFAIFAVFTKYLSYLED
jgi:hypothetical protein